MHGVWINRFEDTVEKNRIFRFLHQMCLCHDSRRIVYLNKLKVHQTEILLWSFIVLQFIGIQNCIAYVTEGQRG